MTDPIRLSKRLIELVGCSRREAELFIEGGWVSVDGEVIDEPQFKVTTQKVELDPEAKATAGASWGWRGMANFSLKQERTKPTGETL